MGWGLGIGTLGCWEGDTFGIHISYQEEIEVGADMQKKNSPCFLQLLKYKNGSHGSFKQLVILIVEAILLYLTGINDLK